MLAVLLATAGAALTLDDGEVDISEAQFYHGGLAPWDTFGQQQQFGIDYS